MHSSTMCQVTIFLFSVAIPVTVWSWPQRTVFHSDQERVLHSYGSRYNSAPPIPRNQLESIVIMSAHTDFVTAPGQFATDRVLKLITLCTQSESGAGHYRIKKTACRKILFSVAQIAS